MKKIALLLTFLLLAASAQALSQSLEDYHDDEISTLWGDTETADTWYFLPGGLLLVSSYEEGREHMRPYAYQCEENTLTMRGEGQAERVIDYLIAADAEVAAVFEQPPDAPVLTCEAQQLQLLGYVGAHTPLEGLWEAADGKALLFFQDFAHTLRREAGGSYLYLGGATVDVGADAVQVLETWDGGVLPQGTLGFRIAGDQLTLDGVAYTRR